MLLLLGVDEWKANRAECRIELKETRRRFIECHGPDYRGDERAGLLECRIEGVELKEAELFVRNCDVRVAVIAHAV